MKDEDLIGDLLGIPSFEKPKTYAEREWEGMPEYAHADMTSDTHIIMHFRSNKDREEFSKIIGQGITAKTKTLWYPMLEKRQFEDKRYVSEDSLTDVENLGAKVVEL